MGAATQTRTPVPSYRVKLLARVVRAKKTLIKIRYLEGELATLEEFVLPLLLRCPWKDWPAVQKDERREVELQEAISDQERPGYALCEAAETVFEAAEEPLYLDRPAGYTITDATGALGRMAVRAGMDYRPWTYKPCFLLRDGRRAVINRQMVDLAIALAAAEPESAHLYVDHLYVDGLEAQYTRDGLMPGKSYLHQMLREYKPGWALARQWAGGPQGRDVLRDEVARLQVGAAGPRRSQRPEGV